MKLFILLAGWFIVLTACNGSSECSGKQVTCPPFNDPVALQWLPYKANQRIIFSSATAASDTFKIDYATLSESHQERISARQPFCTSEASFGTRQQGSPQLQISVISRNNQYNSSDEGQVNINIKGKALVFTGLSDTGLVNSSDLIGSHFYNTAAVAGKTFSNVQQVYFDTTRTVFKSSEIYRFWIARQEGIVGYEEYHGNLWVKQ